MDTICVGLLSAHGAPAGGPSFPRGVPAWGAAPVGGRPPSHCPQQQARMAELLHHHHRGTASGQHPVKALLSLPGPSRMFPRCLRDLRCPPHPHSATPAWRGLFWRPAGGSNRSKRTSTSTRTVDAFSWRSLPDSSCALRPLSLCRPNPVLRHRGSARQQGAPQ